MHVHNNFHLVEYLPTRYAYAVLCAWNNDRPAQSPFPTNMLKSSKNLKTIAAVSIPPRQDLKFEVLKRFRLVFKAAQQHANRIESYSGISNAQLWAIWEISQNPGIRVTELAQALSIHQTTASNMLEKLCKNGLIIRERMNEDDLRVVSLRLTDSGQQLLVNSPKPPQGVLQNALFNLPDHTLISLERNLDELIQMMNGTDPNAQMRPLEFLGKSSEIEWNFNFEDNSWKLFFGIS